MCCLMVVAAFALVWAAAMGLGAVAEGLALMHLRWRHAKLA